MEGARSCLDSQLFSWQRIAAAQWSELGALKGCAIKLPGSVSICALHRLSSFHDSAYHCLDGGSSVLWKGRPSRYLEPFPFVRYTVLALFRTAHISASIEGVHCSRGVFHHTAWTRLLSHKTLSQSSDSTFSGQHMSASALASSQTGALSSALHSGMQCFFFSQNIGYVTPKISYFHYLQKYFLAQSIRKILYLILKKDALAAWHHTMYSLCKLWACTHAICGIASKQFVWLYPQNLLECIHSICGTVIRAIPIQVDSKFPRAHENYWSLLILDQLELKTHLTTARCHVPRKH